MLLPVAFSGGHHLFLYYVPEEGNCKFFPCVRTFYLFDTAKYSENFSLYVDLEKLQVADVFHLFVLPVKMFQLRFQNFKGSNSSP
jgi:hypothetical protein